MNPEDIRPEPKSLAKLAERKKELTGAYNLLILLFAVIFIGALLDYGQGMNPILPTLVIIAALGGLGITLHKLVTITKEN